MKSYGKLDECFQVEAVIYRSMGTKSLVFAINHENRLAHRWANQPPNCPEFKHRKYQNRNQTDSQLFYGWWFLCMNTIYGHQTDWYHWYNFNQQSTLRNSFQSWILLNREFFSIEILFNQKFFSIKIYFNRMVWPLLLIVSFELKIFQSNSNLAIGRI